MPLLICDECTEFIVACEGELDETVVCKKCGAPVTSKEIVAVLHKAAQLEAEKNALARILAKKNICVLVDPLLTDEERDIVFDAMTALGGET